VNDASKYACVGYSDMLRAELASQGRGFELAAAAEDGG
jgi:hypothetical protein